jgi:hypothetical protein
VPPTAASQPATSGIIQDNHSWDITVSSEAVIHPHLECSVEITHGAAGHRCTALTKSRNARSGGGTSRRPE